MSSRTGPVAWCDQENSIGVKFLPALHSALRARNRTGAIIIRGPWLDVTEAQQCVCHTAIVTWCYRYMMTSWNENIFYVTGLLWGESIDDRWVPLSKAMQWRGAFMFSLICSWTNGWANNRDTGDLRRHRANYDFTVMYMEDVNVTTSVSFVTAIFRSAIYGDKVNGQQRFS